MAYLSIQDLTKSFPIKGKPDFVALDGISLEIEKGEFATLIGHSGCGKSTLLDLIGGLTQPTTGRIICDSRPVTGPGPDRAMVFQSHALLPWLTCFENVLLGVRQVFSRTESKSELSDRTAAALELVHLTHAAKRYPAELSGGMKQRVGIARALAVEPALLLLDEPFGALDALTRASLQDELMGIMADTATTTVMVTHDLDEAILLSDRILMMTNGPAAQIGDDLAVAIDRPRDRLELATARGAVRYREQVLEFLYRRQARRVESV
ncbi:nitrate/nitrite transport system ATP-binding protein [Jannaschia faecimaris]|uniref:Nitrate/nitrite transport system ATP-binding protein n=1 Tax=Jannaschia faecimaris TaxID=1244108 RepID=A0A1H3NJ16_9RHOB|nr:ABC transporter ATP-binding protein [Jannaschia faecimaris]SDY88926.1 nitrate/nitrite transport system ATP-binding protein [Jannaschia faecimaris]